VRLCLWTSRPRLGPAGPPRPRGDTSAQRTVNFTFASGLRPGREPDLALLFLHLVTVDITGVGLLRDGLLRGQVVDPVGSSGELREYVVAANLADPVSPVLGAAHA
jgi:hypothetical protein